VTGDVRQRRAVAVDAGNAVRIVEDVGQTNAGRRRNTGSGRRTSSRPVA
jgi:hypothetical protein